MLSAADNFAADVIFVVITPQFMIRPELICKLFVESSFKTNTFPVLAGVEFMQAANIS